MLNYNKIREIAKIYITEINKITHHLGQEKDANKREKLLLLRTITTIKRGNTIVFYDDLMDELTVKNMAYRAELDNSELINDIMILIGDTKEKLFSIQPVSMNN